MKTLSSDDELRSSMSTINWDRLTRAETASFGTTMGLIRDAEMRLCVHGNIVKHKIVVFVLLFLWALAVIVGGIAMWIAMAVPVTAGLFDMLRTSSKNALLAGIVSQHRSEMTTELKQLSKKYPTVK